MIKAKSHEKDGQTWNDVWYVRIPEEEGIDKIIFSDVPLSDSNGEEKVYAGRTDVLTIPDTNVYGGKPCFYADAGEYSGIRAEI